MKKYILCFTACLFASSIYIAAAEEISLTLDESVAIALRDNRNVLLMTEDIKRAKAMISEAYAGVIPIAGVSSTWSRLQEYYPKDFSSVSSQLSVKETIYDGGKTINSIGQNEYRLAVARALLDKTKLETVLSVKNAFYTVLLAQEFAKINEGILNNTESHLNFAKTRYKKGLASESDVLVIEESLIGVQEARQASLNQVLFTEALFKNILYMDDSADIKLKGAFAYETGEVAYDEGFLKAMSKRPEIRQYEAQQKADAKSIEVAKAGSRPTIYASWDYYNKTHGAAGTAKNWNDYNVIGLTFSWPIFDGWAAKARVEQAIAALKETQLIRESMVKDIALELRTAYLDLKNAIAKLKAKEAEAALYQDTLKVVSARYKGGIASSLDLDDAALGLKVAEYNKTQAAYDYILAKARFDKSMGD